VVYSRQEKAIYVFSKGFRLSLVPTHSVGGGGDFAAEVKRPWREAGHSSLLASRLRKRGAIPPFPHTSKRSER